MDTQPSQPQNPLAKAICNALDQGELQLHYQPQFDPETEDTAGLEAFLRWQPPGRSLQRAGQFISVVEGSPELVQRIDIWVLSTALAQADSWLQQGYEFGVLSINLSGWMQIQPSLDYLRLALPKRRLPAKNLALECPWRILSQDQQAVLRAMRQLAGLGCQINLNDPPLDDQCLQIAKDSPVRVTKVSVDYLHQLIEAEGTKAVAKRIKQWRSAGIEIAAVGVEQEQHLASCQQIGCRLTQGNRFKSPLPAAGMGQLLEMIKQTKIAFGLL
ncbi:MAG: EAL domain-containing protein [Gammaproteobacteria bacterium]|nr:EAL domain-containing protein [Gammaproteobacteria bacterium]